MLVVGMEVGFPKDVAALQKIAKDNSGIDLQIIKAASDVNKKQKYPIQKISKKFKGKLKDKKIAVWGLSFKPETMI